MSPPREGTPTRLPGSPDSKYPVSVESEEGPRPLGASRRLSDRALEARARRRASQARQHGLRAKRLWASGRPLGADRWLVPRYLRVAGRTRARVEGRCGTEPGVPSLTGVTAEWRPVTDGPVVSEWITKAALAMLFPRHLVILISDPRLAPAAIARSIDASGSSTNSSIRVLVAPSGSGLFSDGLFGLASWRKTGAPSISKPATPPRFHSSVAPSAFLYQATAAEASGTISITETDVDCGTVPAPQAADS
jgi:hypothetical protein